MSNLINDIHRKVFNTKIIRKPKASFSVEGPEAGPKDIVIEYLEVKLIVMSYDTHVEIMRNDYAGVTGMTGMSLRQDKSQPYRMFGIRVAFDDSLPLNEVLVAGDVV
jgi:hypothetical protein